MFSVLIPSYNHSRFITQSIYSAVRSHFVTEVIVVDDGSKDRTAVILESLKDAFPQKLKLIPNKTSENLGAHNRLNQLISNAKNEWISILNSDDYYISDRLSVISTALRHTDAEMFFGNILIVDQNNRKLARRSPFHHTEYPFPKEFNIERLVLNRDWLTFLLNQNVIATTSNVVFTKSLYHRVGGFRAYRYVHDWDFFLRACALGKAHYDEKLHLAYRLHGSNTILDSKKAVIAEVQQVFREFLSDFPSVLDGQSPAQSRARDAALVHNRYLDYAQSGLLTLVDESPTVKNCPKIKTAFPFLKICNKVEDVTTKYHMIFNDPHKMLNVQEIANALLTLTFIDTNIIYVDNCLTSPTSIPVEDFRNRFIISRNCFCHANIDKYDEVDTTGWLIRIPQHDSRDLPLVAQAMVDIESYEKNRIHVRGSSSTGKANFVYHDSRYLGLFDGMKSGKPVVFIFPAFMAVGGVEAIIIELMKQLKHKYDFVLICTEKLNAHHGSKIFQAFNHCAAYFDLTEAVPKSRFVQAIAYLKAEFKPQVLWICNGSVWQFEHAAELKTIFSDILIIDNQVYDESNGWIRWLSDKKYQIANTYIAINRRIMRKLQTECGIPVERIRQIYHPIDLERARNAVPLAFADFNISQCVASKPKFAFVGRLVDQKRPLEFLQFAMELKKTGFEASFFVAGTGHLREECDKFVNDHDITNVHFLGALENACSLLAAVDGLIIFSKYEGLPVTMLEAMSLGLPVFSTDVGDITLILSEYSTGSTIDVNTPIEKAVSSFLDWWSSIEVFRHNARAAIPAITSRFSGESISKVYESCFQETNRSGPVADTNFQIENQSVQ